MSLLSNTQGTPHRVYGLLRLVAALDGASQRTNVEALMTARSEPGEQENAGRTAFLQTLGAARDLGLIVEEKGTVALSEHGCPDDYRSFADLVHRRLTSGGVDDGDAVVLDAYAYVAHRTDAGASPGPHWFMAMGRDAIADAFREFIDGTRGSAGVGTFNTTRLAPWQKWTELVGLTVAMERDRPFPDIGTRLAREIETDAGMPVEADIPARAFLDRVLERMPYIPGGKRSVELLGPPATNRVPELVASALRDLEADGVLSLQAVGDAGNASTLPPDAIRAAKSFNSVRIGSR